MRKAIDTIAAEAKAFWAFATSVDAHAPYAPAFWAYATAKAADYERTLALLNAQ